jgi:hypothetical protein
MEMPNLLAEIAGPGRRTKWHSSVHKIDIGSRIRHRGPTIISPVKSIETSQSDNENKKLNT